MSRSPFSLGTKILATGAALLGLFLLVGYLLPAAWEAEASRFVPAPPHAVFRYLDSPEGWRAWTLWPDSGVERTGPERGEGASLSWDDRELGSGSFTLRRTSPPELVEYVVDVGDGAMRTEGVVTVAAESNGARVTWREEGHLGPNPLMGYWALSMGRAQTEELAKALGRLSLLAVDGRPRPR